MKTTRQTKNKTNGCGKGFTKEEKLVEEDIVYPYQVCGKYGYFCKDCLNKTNGCGKECRISQLTNEVLICGVSDMKGSLFYCDDCINKVQYKCPNCKRERTQEKKVLVLCGCGYEMELVK